MHSLLNTQSGACAYITGTRTQNTQNSHSFHSFHHQRVNLGFSQNQPRVYFIVKLIL